MKLIIVDPTSLDKEDRSELDANIDSLIAGLKDSRQEINRIPFIKNILIQPCLAVYRNRKIRLGETSV